MSWHAHLTRARHQLNIELHSASRLPSIVSHSMRGPTQRICTLAAILQRRARKLRIELRFMEASAVQNPQPGVLHLPSFPVQRVPSSPSKLNSCSCTPFPQVHLRNPTITSAAAFPTSPAIIHQSLDAQVPSPFLLVRGTQAQ